MSLNRVHVMLILAWFALVAIVTATAMFMGSRLSMTTGVLVFAVACVPPIIALMVFRGAPGRSTVELIYDAEQNKSTDRTKS